MLFSPFPPGALRRPNLAIELPCSYSLGLGNGISSGASLCAVPRRSRGVPSLTSFALPTRLSLALIGHSLLSAADSAQAEELS